MRKIKTSLLDIFKKLIVEQYNEDYYNKILDLYNEVGIEGMTPDEVEYLKSGGSSETPDRFKNEDDLSLEDDDEHFAIQWENLEKLKSIVERIPTEIEFMYDNLPSPSNLYFVLVFDFNNKLFTFLHKKFGDKKIKNTNIRPVKIMNDKIHLSIPKSWFDELFEPS